jgi:hypothetical protein
MGDDIDQLFGPGVAAAMLTGSLLRGQAEDCWSEQDFPGIMDMEIHYHCCPI